MDVCESACLCDCVYKCLLKGSCCSLCVYLIPVPAPSIFIADPLRSPLHGKQLPSLWNRKAQRGIGTS